MTRGKYGVKAAKRRETQEYEAEIAQLRQDLDRATKDRDWAKELFARKEAAAAEERRGLLADVANGASVRTRQLEEREVELINRLRDAEAALEDLDRTHTKVWQWAHDHLQTDHGFGYNDAFEYLLPIIGVFVGGLSKLGIAGAKRGEGHISLLGQNERAIAAIQRARGVRR